MCSGWAVAGRSSGARLAPLAEARLRDTRKGVSGNVRIHELCFLESTQPVHSSKRHRLARLLGPEQFIAADSAGGGDGDGEAGGLGGESPGKASGLGGESPVPRSPGKADPGPCVSACLRRHVAQHLPLAAGSHLLAQPVLLRKVRVQKVVKDFAEHLVGTEHAASLPVHRA